MMDKNLIISSMISVVFHGFMLISIYITSGLVIICPYLPFFIKFFLIMYTIFILEVYILCIIFVKHFDTKYKSVFFNSDENQFLTTIKQCFYQLFIFRGICYAGMIFMNRFNIKPKQKIQIIILQNTEFKHDIRVSDYWVVNVLALTFIIMILGTIVLGFVMKYNLPH